MKAVVLHEHGGPEKLVYEPDYREPEVIAGHVIVRVRATSLNYHDVFTRRGMPGIKVPLPVIIGLDLAGDIAEIGQGVTRLERRRPRAGDPIHPKRGLMGEMLDGGLAEYLPGRGGAADPAAGRRRYDRPLRLPVAYGTADG